jgi:DUF1680 family protein
MTGGTRRDALKLIGAGAASVVLPELQASQPPASAGRSAVRHFGLADVRLLDGPFLDARNRNAAYLLAIEPDRLLNAFRRNAGLAPKGEIYGGWESQEPWVDIRCQGHTLGHYLSACAHQFAATGAREFHARVDYICAELRACQEARGSGLLCAFPDDAAQLENSLAGRPFVGVPWYTLHKVLAGLRDAHVEAQARDARNVLLGLAGWVAGAVATLADADLQRMLDREHGGMNEVLADVYALTGDVRYRDLALRFSHRALLDPLAAHRDALDGLHANTQIPKVVGFSRIHELTRAADYGAAASFFWTTVVRERSFATGGHGDLEHFFPPAEFASHRGSAKTMETCGTHNMLRLTRALYEQDPRVEYVDYIERALFNGILASQDPQSGMVTYFQATRPGYVKLYCTPRDSFWCCTGSGMENHAKYGDCVYAHGDDSLTVNLFMASTLAWTERRISLTQSTRFPDEETSRLTIGLREPQQFTLRIRQPHWCDRLAVRINDGGTRTARRPGNYLELHRAWRDGDVVDIRFPMALRLEPLPHAPAYAAVIFGPIVLAGRLGRAGITPGSDQIVNERESGTMLNETVPIPVWSRPASEFLSRVSRPDPTALAFNAAGFDDDRSVELVPYFRIAHERYNLYWRLARS